jgi:hypothetical protein
VTTKDWARIWEEVQEQSTKAWHEAAPTPMIVYTPKGLFDDTPDPTQPVYRVDEGVCGFGWIELDGRSGLARWLKSKGIGRQGDSKYRVSSWEIVSADRMSQSYTRKDAAVRAGAKVLRDLGVKAYGMARLD